MLHHDPLLNCSYRRLQRLELRRQHDQACPRIVWQLRIGIICDDRKQLLDPFASLRSYNAEFGQVGSHSIDQLCALAHQKIAGTMLHQLGLLFG